jgi:hypothetical protein
MPCLTDRRWGRECSFLPIIDYFCLLPGRPRDYHLNNPPAHADQEPIHPPLRSPMPHYRQGKQLAGDVTACLQEGQPLPHAGISGTLFQSDHGVYRQGKTIALTRYAHYT